MKRTRICITGGSGLVGGELSQRLSGDYTLLVPERLECDITNSDSVHSYMNMNRPEFIIHAAAFTDNTSAERERGNKNGMCWKTNVDGTQHIVDAAGDTGAFVIFISTGSVFSGDKTHTGPFSEEDPVMPESWYGYTKAYAEKLVSGGAVIRISHPLCKSSKDYLHTLTTLYDSHSLYPLFTDQLFPVTDMGVLTKAIGEILRLKHKGIFHIVSSDSVSPYELLRRALLVSRGIHPVLESALFQKSSPRFTQFSAITGQKSMNRLHLAPYSWKDVIDSIYTNT